MAYPEHIKRRAIELSEGRSDGAILRLLEREFPEEVVSLNVRTISRWRRHKSEILAQASGHITGEQGIGSPESWQEHRARLAGVADKLLANDLKRVIRSVEPTGDIKYLLYDESETDIRERLTDDDLSVRLEENLLTVYRDYTDWFYKNCFIPHLFAEWSEDVQTKMSRALLYDEPYLLIETLRLLAERKTFKGSCPVCKDWQ